MVRWIAVCGVVAGFAGAAAGQTVLYGVRENGDVLRINPGTGVAHVLGSTGVPCQAARGVDGSSGRGGSHGAVLTAGGEGEWADRIAFVDRWSGTLSAWETTTGRPAGYRVSGMAGPGWLRYVLLKHDQGGDDLLAQVFSSEYTVIGSTGRRDLEDIAWTPSGLVALGGGALYSVSETTGAATLIGGDGFVGDEQSLTYHPDLGLLACGSVLSSVNLATGTATGIGPTGFTRITGLAAVNSCYVNCDTGGPPPILSVNDFVCFMTFYASGHPYANCDKSTTPPVLNVNDFVCFVNLWGVGCP